MEEKLVEVLGDVLKIVMKKEDYMTYRESTNPHYEGNSEGVKAHLRNTIRLELNPSAFSNIADQQDALVNAITQRWHLTPARDFESATEGVLQVNQRLAEQNIQLRRAVELFLQLDELNAHVDVLNEQLTELMAEADENDAKADAIMTELDQVMAAI